MSALQPARYDAFVGNLDGLLTSEEKATLCGALDVLQQRIPDDQAHAVLQIVGVLACAIRAANANAGTSEEVLEAAIDEAKEQARERAEELDRAIDRGTAELQRRIGNVEDDVDSVKRDVSALERGR